MLANGHLFLYANSICPEMAMLMGWRDCQVTAFDDKDEIAGFGYDAGNAQKMFVYSRKKVIVIEAKGPLSKIKPAAMNNYGVIVGTLTLSNSEKSPPQVYFNHTVIVTRGPDHVDRAVVIKEGKITDLNTMLDPKSGWILESASGINNKGQIVGMGQHHGKTTAFLLIPKINEEVSAGALVRRT